MRGIIAGIIALALSWSILPAQTLTIYTEESPPYQVVGPSGEPQGYAVEIVREIQKRVGSKEIIQVVPWIRGYHEIQTRANVALFSMAWSQERDPDFEWVGPLYETSHYFFVRADSKAVIHSLDDARKLGMIGVYKEDIRDQYLTRLGFTNLDRSPDQTVMFKKLMSGRIDAIAGSPEAMDEIAKSAGFTMNEVKRSFSFLTVQGFIAFSKGTAPSLVKDWAEALQAMKKDGTFGRIYRRFFPGLPLPGPSVKPS